MNRHGIGAVKKDKTKFLWYPFIPFGLPSVFQGQCGYGKTTLVCRIMAELSHGVYPMRMAKGFIKGRLELTPWQQYAIEYMRGSQEDEFVDADSIVTRIVNGMEVVGIDEEEHEELREKAVPIDKPFMRPIGDPIKMVYISRENPYYQIREKYEEYGGDPAMLDVIDEEEERFLITPSKVEDLIGEAKFAVIDPVFPFIEGSLFSNDDVDKMMHESLEPVAKKTGAAILLLNNLTKRGTASDVNAGLGASNLMNIARSGFKIDIEDKMLYVEPVKNNVGGNIGRLGILKDEFGRVDYINYRQMQNGFRVDQDQETLEATKSPKQHEAISLLKKLLHNGPVDYSEIVREAANAGISKSTLDRARQKIGVDIKRTHGNDTAWRLSDEGTAPA